MKKFIISLLTVLLLLSATTVFALPYLQLDIVDGVYDPLTETTVATSQNFTLQALVDPRSPRYVQDADYYLSIAVYPGIGQTNPAPNLGLFTVDGNPIQVAGDMTWGTPPVLHATGADLPGHGVFPTYFTELPFQIDPSSMIAAYDVQTGDAAGPPGHQLYLFDFDIDRSLLDPSVILHFDLYTFNARDGIIFAPFSHDAQSHSAPVPEPGTLLLLGAGLAMAGACSRRRDRR